MRRTLVLSLFMLATLVWAAAQRPGTMPQGSGGQATSPGAQAPSSQVPDASQSQAPTPGSAGQQGAQSGAQAGEPGQMSNAPIIEGCLGGSNPNYTVTDNAGTTYKINVPAGADVSSLASHVGESVAVQGTVNKAGSANSASIDALQIGRGRTKCPGSSANDMQSTPKQQNPPQQ